METLSIRKKHPEALTSSCSSAEESNSSSLTHFLRKKKKPKHLRPILSANFMLGLIASTRTDLLYVESMEMCVFSFDRVVWRLCQGRLLFHTTSSHSYFRLIYLKGEKCTICAHLCVCVCVCASYSDSGQGNTHG